MKPRMPRTKHGPVQQTAAPAGNAAFVSAAPWRERRFQHRLTSSTAGWRSMSQAGRWKRKSITAALGVSWYWQRNSNLKLHLIMFLTRS